VAGDGVLWGDDGLGDVGDGTQLGNPRKATLDLSENPGKI
jgi:hypothetical protein